MEICSLEDDDYEGLFITQSDKSLNNSGITGNSSILGDPMDFSSPLVTLTPRGENKMPEYSDISDDELDPFPCSQNYQSSPGHSQRFVITVCKLKMSLLSQNDGNCV